LAALGKQTGTLGDSDETFVEYFADSTNRVRDVIGGLFLIGGAISFVMFLVLAESLQGDRSAFPISKAAWVYGIILATLILIAASMASATSLSRIYAEVFDEGAGLSEGNAASVLPQLATVLLMTASLLAAAWITVTSLAALDSTLLARPVCYIGFAAAILLVASAAAVPLWPFPVWLFVAAFTVRPPEPLA
jgi:hypothetical protein